MEGNVTTDARQSKHKRYTTVLLLGEAVSKATQHTVTHTIYKYNLQE